MKDIFLTFDMDWAPEKMMEWFYGQCVRFNIVGTLFVTNESHVIEDIRHEKRFELGIHPNFNYLLGGDNSAGARNYLEEIHRVKDIVPDAVSVRSHALTVNTLILREFSSLGLKYESNILYEPKMGDKVRPFYYGTDLVRLPIIFADDIWAFSGKLTRPDFYISEYFEAPLIFDFHPIHLYLNTNDEKCYKDAKPFYQNFSVLTEYRNTTSYGVFDFFIELVEKCKDNGYRFVRINDKEWEKE